MTAKGRFPGSSSGASELQALTASMGNVGTDANTNEKVLKVSNIPGGTLNANGKFIRFRAWGQTAANGNAKTIRVRLGTVTLTGTVLFLASGPTWNNQDWMLEGVIVRSDVDAQINSVTFVAAQGASSFDRSHDSTTSAQDDGSALVLEITGQNGSASANDIVCAGLIAEVVSAP